MKRRFKDVLLGVKDIPFAFEGALGNGDLSYVQKTKLARRWLKEFELRNVAFLRSQDYSHVARYDDVTLVTYTFPQEESDYLQVEFAVLHTWRMLGRMPTVIVANRHFPLLDAFASKWRESVTVQIQPALVCGDNRCISVDCLENLYKRFSTDFCLAVQDDGFPILDNIGDFLGLYDFVGAPVVRARVKPIEKIIEITNRAWLNGGFSLRSRRLCELGARANAQWRASGRPFQQEDVFFSQTLRKLGGLAKGLRYPSLQHAREFSATDIGGCVDIHARGYKPFGFHSPTTALQLKVELAVLGYDIPS